MDKLKIGFPLYLNTLPLLFYLNSKNTNFEIILDVPKNLNFKLSQNIIHGSLSSSICYARNPQEYFIVPDISISAVGEVKSVILFHKKPLEKLNGKKIGITPESESSFNLLRILFEEFIGIKPIYLELNKHWKELSQKEKEELSGYLAIGDEALILGMNNSEKAFITDLAELWLKYTRLPFVFALLLIRKEIVNKQRKILKNFCLKLYYSRAKAFSNLKEIIEKSHIKLPKKYAYYYLTHLEHDFSPLKQKAFLTFCEYLYKMKIIKKIPELNFLNIL